MSTWEVIDFLVGLHAGKEIGLDMVISPADIEVEIGEWVSLKKPFILFGHMLNHCVLCICITSKIPLTFITTLFFLPPICAL